MDQIENKVDDEYFKIVMKQIGAINPLFDPEVNEWIFCHPDYPVEYGGTSPEEVIENYPKYLREFIYFRKNGKLNPLTEKKTKGLAGIRIKK